MTTTATKLCSVCPRLAVVGTRCFRHYLGRLANTRGLRKERWYLNREVVIEAVLLARYRAGRMGLAGSEPDDLVQVMAKGKGEPLRQAKVALLTGLLETVDARARRDRDADRASGGGT